MESWTLDAPLPTPETVEEIDPLVFDAILNEAAPLMLAAVQGKAFGPSGFSDPKVLTDESPDSDEPSKGASARSTSRTKKP